MTTTERHMLELLTKLPPAAQTELFDFAEFLLQKHGSIERPLSALNILAESLTEVSFHSADEVRTYLNEERDSWER